MQSERLRALQMEKADTEEEAANLRREIRELEEASQSNDRSHKGMEARTAGLRAALEEANAKVLEYESKAGEMRQELQAMVRRPGGGLRLPVRKKGAGEMRHDWLGVFCSTWQVSRGEARGE